MTPTAESKGVLTLRDSELARALRLIREQEGLTAHELAVRAMTKGRCLQLRQGSSEQEYLANLKRAGYVRSDDGMRYFLTAQGQSLLERLESQADR